MLNRTFSLAICTLLVLLCAPLTAMGQTQRGGGSSDGGHNAQQLMQLSAERAAAQAEATTAKQQLADAQKELSTLKTERDGLRARLTSLESQHAKEDGQSKTLASELEASRQALANSNRTNREQASELRTTQTSLAQLRDSINSYDRDYDICVKHNLELTGIAREALERYEHVGISGYLARAEPFTKLSQVRVENLTDEYRMRIAKLGLKHGEHPIVPSDPKSEH